MSLRVYSPDVGDGAFVPEIVEQYLSHLRGRVDIGDYSSDALANIDRELRHFAADHPYHVSECKQNDLTRWLEQNPQWASAHTKKRIIAEVVGCFRWAAEEELIGRCPYRRVKSVSNIPYVPRRPADHAEYVLLMRKGSRPLRRALFFLRRIGARTCEMREAVWDDCRLDGESMHICLYRHKTARKTGKCRKIGLDKATAQFLRNLRRQSVSDHVFVNCDGNAWSRRSFAQHFRRCAERLGLNAGVGRRLSAYCFRHAYVVDGIEAGVSTRCLADQLGHQTTEMIDRVYGSHTRDREEHLAKVAEDVLRKRLRGR